MSATDAPFAASGGGPDPLLALVTSKAVPVKVGGSGVPLACPESSWLPLEPFQVPLIARLTDSSR